MKVFIDLLSGVVKKIENEYPILSGNNYVDTLKVYYNANPSTGYFYPTINLLKPNNRKVGQIQFDDGSLDNTYPQTYTDDDSNTWYYYAFTLTSDNGQIDVSGKYQVTITTNYYNSLTNVITAQRNTNIQLNVLNAVLNEDSDILILGESVDDVVASMHTLLQSLQTSVSSLSNSKADKNNSSQDITAHNLTLTNNLAVAGGITIDGVAVVDKDYVDTKAALNGPSQTIIADKVKVNEINPQSGGQKIDFSQSNKIAYSATHHLFNGVVNADIIKNTDNNSTVQIKSDEFSFTDVNSNTMSFKNNALTVNKVTGLANPTSNSDATSKLYVDAIHTAISNDIDTLKSVQNVVDVVATYAALEAYDITNLEDNDKIQVVADESITDSPTTIYSWDSANAEWDYVGAYGGNSYTKTQTDTKLQAYAKLNDATQNIISNKYSGKELVIEPSDNSQSDYLKFDSDNNGYSVFELNVDYFTSSNHDNVNFNLNGNEFNVNNAVIYNFWNADVENPSNSWGVSFYSGQMYVVGMTDITFMGTSTINMGADADTPTSVVGIATPTEATGAANKSYVDNTATACKNYTDQKAEEILWQLAENDVSTSDDNTTASTKTVPANATRCKIKRIYGLTQKFSPSTASDSTSYSVKTMPSTVYDFDVSKVEGKSEVSENLVVFDDVAETTINGVKVKYKDGAIYLDGTANAQFKIAVQFKQPIYANQNYYVKLFTSGSTTATNPKAIGETSTDANLLIPSTTTFNVAYNINYFWFSAGNGTVWTNYVVKPMIVKGTTEPTEFEQGYTGIHNLELSGLKVEGENLMNVADSSSTSGGVSVVSSGGITTINGTTTASINKVISLLDLDLPAGTYTLSTLNTTFNWNNIGGVYIGNGEWNSVASVEGSTGYRTFTLTETTHIDRVRFYANNGTTFNNVVLKIMLVRGSSVPTEYQPYIAPTTKTIDLSTILYNGSPLFEGNSLKAVGTAKDYITPYKAHKQIQDLTVDSNTIITETSTPTTNGVGVRITTNYNAKALGELMSTLSVDKITYGSFYNGAVGIALFNNSDQPYIYVRLGADYDTLDKVKNYLINNGIIFNYELATPIEVSIDWSSTLRGIQGYSNGTITLLNTNNQDTDNTITYNSMIKENCCAKIVQSRGGNVVKTITLTDDDTEYGYSATNTSNVRDYTTNEGTINVGKRAYQSGDESDTDVITDMDYTYYPLDEPTTDTLTAIENVIEVQPSDVLSFYDENDNLVTVPSDLTYRIEVAE